MLTPCNPGTNQGCRPPPAGHDLSPMHSQPGAHLALQPRCMATSSHARRFAQSSTAWRMAPARDSSHRPTWRLIWQQQHALLREERLGQEVRMTYPRTPIRSNWAEPMDKKLAPCPSTSVVPTQSKQLRVSVLRDQIWVQLRANIQRQADLSALPLGEPTLI